MMFDIFHYQSYQRYEACFAICMLNIDANVLSQQKRVEKKKLLRLCRIQYNFHQTGAFIALIQKYSFPPTPTLFEKCS